MFSKKFTTAILREAITPSSQAIVKMWQAVQQPLEVKIYSTPPSYETYTVVNINPYTLEEQLILYPAVIVHETPGYPQPVVINIQ